MAGQAIDDNIRALIQAELLSGIKPIQIKEKYDVSLPTISRIKQSIAPHLRDKMDLRRQDVLSDLVLTHLEVSLEGGINVMLMTRNKEWMRSQNASDLNKLYGTATDKAIRMAETIELTQKQVTQEDEAVAEEDELLNTDTLSG